MSQIRKSSLALALLLSLFALSGCGDRNTQATFDPATFKHIDPAAWKVSTHKVSALADMENCAECHGSDFTGGISKVNCTTQCHIGGADSVHPLSWGKSTNSIILGHKISTNSASCITATCHAVGGAAQQKLCTSCHANPSSKHPEDFTLATKGFAIHANYVNANTNASCAVASCHGTDLLGNTGAQSTGAFGPSCHKCHPNHL